MKEALRTQVVDQLNYLIENNKTSIKRVMPCIEQESQAE